MLIKLCKRYSHFLEYGKTYNGIEFAAQIQQSTKRTLKTLQNSPLFFQRTQTGIILDFITF